MEDEKPEDGKPFDLSEIMRDAEKKLVEETKDLESRARPLYELVVRENFTVVDVTAESYATLFTPHSEIVIGGISPVYRGGFTSRLTLTVRPENKDVPVRTLVFDGISPVEARDYISAYIPRYEEKTIRGFRTGCYDTNRRFYLDREFNEEESAIELAIMSVDGEVVRRDRAVNYNSFVRK